MSVLERFTRRVLCLSGGIGTFQGIMDYVHVKNIEKYHAGYKDRPFQWAKIFITMIQGDPDCEMITNETDWARLIKFILLELKAQKPIPLDPIYLSKKGFDLKARPISLTLNMLHHFIETVTQPLHLSNGNVDKSRVEKSREDNSDFEAFWYKYPKKQGKQDALRAWNKLSPKGELLKKINEGVRIAIVAWNGKDTQYIPHASTWLNGKRWEDELNVKKTTIERDFPVNEFYSDARDSK